VGCCVVGVETTRFGAGEIPAPVVVTPGRGGRGGGGRVELFTGGGRGGGSVV